MPTATSTPADADLLTTREVAELHRVSEQTVRRWVRQQRIRARRTPGGSLRFDRESVATRPADLTTGPDPRGTDRTGRTGTTP